MLSVKIKIELENSAMLRSSVDQQGSEWADYTRTAFTKIAKIINQKVTQDVIDSPILIEDNLLIGSNEMDRIFRKESLSTIQEFIITLKSIPKYRTYNWISGKTLQAYWVGDTIPKEKKVNVLLTYLDVDFSEWEDWKSPSSATSISIKLDPQQELINKYYAGNYYRYYQKTNKSQSLIKVPLQIFKAEDGKMVVESKTVGHGYQSTSVDLRDGAMYIQMKNLNWDEYEFHIINVGFAVAPKVLMGTSCSLNNKKQAVSKRNIFVKTDESFDFSQVVSEEIPFDKALNESQIDYKIQQYFKKEGNNLIVSELVHVLEDLG